MPERMKVLLLPGQGAQRERMAAGLYGRQAEFTVCVTELFESMGAAGDRLAAEWLRTAPNSAMSEADVAQPLLLIVGYALGVAVSAQAGAPHILLGHSVGELAAACLADVFPAGALAPLVAERSRHLDAGGRGGMLAVAAAPGDLPAERAPGVALAAVNGPRQCVLAGPDPALRETEAALRHAGFTVRRLRSDHAFHSPVMRGTADRFRTELSRLRPAPARTTLVSGRTASPVSAAQAADPAFWADQLMLPVRYWPALKGLLDSYGDSPGLVLLDASADRSLTTAARHHAAVRSGHSHIVPLLAPARTTGGPSDIAAWEAALEAADRFGPDPSGTTVPARHPAQA